jgi:hypothetical protein
VKKTQKKRRKETREGGGMGACLYSVCPGDSYSVGVCVCGESHVN